MAGRILLEPEVKDVTLAAGEPAVTAVTITNTGYVVDAFDITIRGLDATWFTLTPTRVSLFPKAQALLTLQLQVPAGSSALAGDYNYELVATSRDAAGEETVVPMRLRLAAAGEISLALEPQRIVSRKGIFQLRVTNDGNVERTVVLRPTDEAGLLQFAFSPATATPLADLKARDNVAEGTAPGQLQPMASTLDTQWAAPGPEASQGALTLTLPPASRADLRVTVSPKKRVWFGREIHHQFEVAATPPGIDYDQTMVRRTAGELVYRPVFVFMAGWPLALQRALLILIPLALFLLLLFLILRPQDNKGALTAAQQTQTAIAAGAAQTQTAAAVAAAAAAQTQTAIAKAAASGNSAAQTAQAAANANATQTALALAGGLNGQAGAPSILKFEWAPTNDGGIQATWEVTPTNGVTITLNGTPVAATGSQPVDVQEDRSVTLIATNGKDIASRSLGVVLLRPPVVKSFTADPTETCSNCEITLRWDVQQADTIAINGTPVPSGANTAKVTPPGATQYVLTADNVYGSTAASVNVTINAAAPSPTPSGASPGAQPTPSP